MIIDYILLVTLFIIGQLLGYYVGRRDERKTIQDFCDSIGLSDLMYQITQEYMEVNENKEEK